MDDLFIILFAKYPNMEYYYIKELCSVDIHNVVISKHADRDLKTVPKHVVKKLIGWIENISHHGLRETKKIAGYHDEPLKGDRSGQRSIRLSKAYRAIYEITQDGTVQIINVIEVNKHVY